jgi:hypothetical protein
VRPGLLVAVADVCGDGVAGGVVGEGVDGVAGGVGRFAEAVECAGFALRVAHQMALPARLNPTNERRGIVKICTRTAKVALP